MTRLFDKGPRKGDTCVKKEFKTGAVYENELFEQDVLVGNKAYIVGTASGFQYPPRSIGCHLRGQEKHDFEGNWEPLGWILGSHVGTQNR